MAEYKITKQERQAYAIAKNIKENQIVIVGTGLPLIGASLAKRVVCPSCHPIVESGLMDVLHKAALLMLHHDDGIAVSSDAVSAAGAGKAGHGLHIVALAVDAGRVHVAVGVDLGAADEGDEPVLVDRLLQGRDFPRPRPGDSAHHPRGDRPRPGVYQDSQGVRMKNLLISAVVALTGLPTVGMFWKYRGME